MTPFRGKVVVVTGAGRGLGRALAQGFLTDGADVVGFGRSEAALREVAASAAPGRMLVVPGDLANRADIARLFATTLAQFGKVDVLVNNAATYPRCRLLDTTIEEWARVMEVNVVGMAHCCMLALPPMIAARHGRILNVGSLAFRTPLPGSSSYSVSKAAVMALTRAVAAEVDPALDIRVNEFLPGIVRTGMSAEGIEPAAVYPHLRHVVSLPHDSPHGMTFLQSEVWEEYVPRRVRAARLLRRVWASLAARRP